MKNLLWLIGFLILTPSFLNAQSLPNATFWEKCGNIPHKHLSYYLAVNSKGEMLMHRGGAISDAVLLRSVDSGKTWVNISDGLPEIYNFIETTPIKAKYMISDLCAVDSTFYCIQTQSNKEKGWLIRTQDLGKTWDRLPVPDSKIHELMAPKLEGCYFEYSRPKKFNYLFPPEDELLWKNSGDKNWYQKKLWLEKNPGFDINTTHFQIFEYHFRDFVGPTKKTFSIVNNPKKIGYHPNSIDPSGELIKSSDRHGSWEVVNTGNIRVTLLNLVDCQGRLYAHLANHTGLHRSSNDGQSWEKLTGISQEDQDDSKYSTDYVTWGCDGRAYTIKGTSIYKSKELICCKGEMEPEMPTYGTTIITHGISLGLKDYLHLDWTERMATAIINKAGYGNVYKYEPESGNLRIMIDASGGRPIGEREDIVIFDWSAESGIKEKGFTAAAAEALYLTLAKLNSDKFGLDKMHFIGHGRGCIVNSLVIEKFYQLEEKGSFSIDQVTNLGPYELDCDIDDEHPDIKIDWPAASTPNNGIVKWGDFPDRLYTDTYWQQNGKQLTFESYQVVGDMILSLAVQRLGNALSNGLIEDQYEQVIFGLKNSLVSQQLALQKANSESHAAQILKEAGNLISALPAAHAQIVSGLLTSTGYALQFFDIYMASNTDSRPVQGSSNFEWKDYKEKTVVHDQLSFSQTDLIGICDAYIETIKNSSFGECTYSLNHDIGGYCLSRLNGGVGHRTYYKGESIKPFDPFNNFNLSDKNIDRVRGVMNGSFDRTSALGINPQVTGWAYHGGGQDFQGPILSGYIGEMATLTHFENKPPPVLRHNRFYIPQDAKQISFLIKTTNVKNGKLNIKLEDVITGEIKAVDVPIDAEIVSFSERKIDISEFSQSVVTLTFEFSGEIYNEKQSLAPSLHLDEIKFYAATNTSSGNSETSTMDNSSKIVLSLTQGNQPFVENGETVQDKIGNSTFETLDVWHSDGGEVKIENETVYLKPKETRKSVLLRHPAIVISDNVRYLKFKINKQSLKKADIKVIAREIRNGTVTTLHEENIRVSALSTLSSEIEKVSKTLDTYTFDAYKSAFDEIAVDITGLRGKVVEFEFVYLPLGSGKPKLFIDDVILK